MSELNGSDASFDRWLNESRVRVYYPTITGGDYHLVPDVPGLYLWGTDSTVDGDAALIPRLIGKSEKNLSHRIIDWKGEWQLARGRYVPGPKSAGNKHPPQGLLATRYYRNIREAAWRVTGDDYIRRMRHLHKEIAKDAFPQDVREDFAREGPRQLTRLYHAVDWALHGGEKLEHLWVVFFTDPVVAAELEALEKQLIEAAAKWNSQRGLPPMLNVHHVKRFNRR